MAVSAEYPLPCLADGSALSDHHARPSIYITFKIAQLVSSFYRRIKERSITGRKPLHASVVSEEFTKEFDALKTKEIDRYFRCPSSRRSKKDSWTRLAEHRTSVHTCQKEHPSQSRINCSSTAYKNMIKELDDMLSPGHRSLVKLAKDDGAFIKHGYQPDLRKRTQQEFVETWSLIQRLLALTSFINEFCIAGREAICKGDEIEQVKFEAKFVANVEHALLCLEGQLLQSIFEQALNRVLEDVEFWQRYKSLYETMWFFVYPNAQRPLSTTWPWSIKPSLAVLWGVCWMFMIFCDVDQFGNLRDPDGKLVYDPVQLDALLTEIQSVSASGLGAEWGWNDPGIPYPPLSPQSPAPHSASALTNAFQAAATTPSQSQPQWSGPTAQSATYEVTADPSSTAYISAYNTAYAAPDSDVWPPSGTTGQTDPSHAFFASRSCRIQEYVTSQYPRAAAIGNDTSRSFYGQDIDLTSTQRQPDRRGPQQGIPRINTGLGRSHQNPYSAFYDQNCLFPGYYIPISCPQMTEIDRDTSKEPVSASSTGSDVGSVGSGSPKTATPKNDKGPFFCDRSECSSLSFERKCELKKHVDKHTRPYRCRDPACKLVAGFTYQGGLFRHQREKHGDQKSKILLPCPWEGCSRGGEKGFTRRENLNEHIRRIHEKGKDNSALSVKSDDVSPPASTTPDATSPSSRNRKRLFADVEHSAVDVDDMHVDELRHENKKLRQWNSDLVKKVEALKKQLTT